MIRRTRIGPLTVSIALIAITATGLPHAQARASSINPPFTPSFPVTGVVQDQSGAIVRDAPVELVTSSGIVERTTRTDAAGAYRFDDVRAGSYELRARVEGFKPTSVRLRVGARAPAPQKLVLKLAELTQEITVNSGAGEVTTAAGENRDAIVIDPKAMENLPIFDQDIVGAVSRFLDEGSLGTGGVTLIVDGMEATSVGVSASAIEQIKINQDPYSAEYARPGRGRIEIITKAGTQSYHGAANFTFRDARLNGRDPFALTRAPEQRRIFEGFSSGPVLGGKTTSFLVSVDRREEDLQAVVFAIDPSGIVQANVPQPRRGLQLSASINHQQGDHNTISLRYTHEGGSTRNQGVGGTTLPESGSDNSSYENQVVYGQRTIANKRLLNELRVTLGAEGASTISQHPNPRIVVLDAFTGGGAQADRLQTQHRIGLTDTVTYSTGRQLIKAGLNIPEWNRRRSDDSTNLGGTFSFSTLQDYGLGRPFSFVQQRGDGHLVFVDKNFGIFVQDQIQARPNLSVALGLRYDWQNHIVDNHNFGPRASFAFAPGPGRSTVIRGGAGVFYDRVEGGPISDLLHSTQGRLVRYVLLDPGFPDPFAAGATNAASPPSIVRLAPDVTIPYIVQYGIGLERQLHKSTTVVINYVGARGMDMFRSRDINAPPPPLYLARPDPAYGVIRQIESTARQRTDSMQVTLRGRVTPFFDGSIQYTLAAAKNDTSGIASLPANNYDLASEWGRADFDQRHRFDLLGRIASGPLSNVGVALSLYSGRPYSLRTGRDDFNTGQSNARPAGVSRNTLEGPGYVDLDLRWSHDFFFDPSRKDKGPAANIGLDAFNLVNRVNFAGYVGNLSSPFFARAVSAQAPRRLQLSVRFKF
jgi:outer membrane receptor protein involved in Fe transport